MSDTETESVDPSWAVQQAIFLRLSTVLTDVKVIDNVEASEFEDALPFILIGDDVVTDAENQLVDEYKVRASIRCHTAGASRKASKLLAHRVRQALKAVMVVEGFVSDESVSYHAGTQSLLIEGIAHVAIVEWVFDLLPDTE